MSNSPPTKRAKTEQNSIRSKNIPQNSKVFSESLFTDAQSLQKAYLEAKPYKHGFIKKLCVDDFLSKYKKSQQNML